MPATWREFSESAPDLSRRVRDLFAITKHHVLATLRADGSPRVSGTEVSFRDDELAIGSMYDARKAHDLQRDPRCAIHANPGDGTMANGDAKIAGNAREITDAAEITRLSSEADPPGPMHLFVIGLTEVVLTSLHPAGDRLVIESWRPQTGLRRVERA